MNAVAIVKSTLLRVGDLALRDIECPCCREASREALKICEGLNTPKEYHDVMKSRYDYLSKQTDPGDKCPAYLITTTQVSLFCERLRVLWRIGQVSGQAIKDVTEIIDGVVSRN